MREALIEAWRTNNRINLLLLDEISDEGLAATLSTRGGRGVGGQFAHESHHRGNILLTLKSCGHNLGKDTRYAIWGWDQL